MKHIVKGSLFIVNLNDLDSSFIKQLVYDAKTQILSVVLKSDNTYNYEKVPLEVFVEFSTTNSFGSFYNSEIKNKYKHLEMAKNGSSNQPERINKAGNHKRFIRMSLDVTKINKDWLYVSKDTGAVYLKATLCMLPDGEVDKYGQLGFIAQEVPREIAKEDKKVRGEILGNAEELEWAKREDEKAELVSEDDKDELNDLPF